MTPIEALKGIFLCDDCKAKKALEIIVKKECLFKGLSEVSQDEFDLLKEVLKEYEKDIQKKIRSK